MVLGSYKDDYDYFSGLSLGSCSSEQQNRKLSFNQASTMAAREAGATKLKTEIDVCLSA